MHLAARGSPLRSPSSAGEACLTASNLRLFTWEGCILRLPGACPAWKCLNIISEGEGRPQQAEHGHLVAGLKRFYLSGRIPLSLSDQLSAELARMGRQCHVSAHSPISSDDENHIASNPEMARLMSPMCQRPTRRALTWPCHAGASVACCACVAVGCSLGNSRSSPRFGPPLAHFWNRTNEAPSQSLELQQAEARCCGARKPPA